MSFTASGATLLASPTLTRATNHVVHNRITPDLRTAIHITSVQRFSPGTNAADGVATVTGDLGVTHAVFTLLGGQADGSAGAAADLATLAVIEVALTAVSSGVSTGVGVQLDLTAPAAATSSGTATASQGSPLTGLAGHGDGLGAVLDADLNLQSAPPVLAPPKQTVPGLVLSAAAFG